MKNILKVMLLSIFLLSGCDMNGSDHVVPAETNQPSEGGSNPQQQEELEQEEQAQQEKPEQMEQTQQQEEPEQMEQTQQQEEPEQEEQTQQQDSPQQNLSERIAKEISDAEEQEKEIEKKQREAVTQMDMNITAAQMYQMWDNTLNVVWKLLEANLNEADMEVLRKEERAWIASKEAQVQAVGQECGGGSIQPSLEAGIAVELTKARVYELAAYAEGR